MATAAASGIEWATRTYSNAKAPVVTGVPGRATTSGGSGTPSASFAFTSSIVNGMPMMRPMGAPWRIRCASAAMWSSWPCVSTTAAIGCVPSTRTSGSSCSTTPSRSLVGGEADAAIDDDALGAPVEHRHVPSDLAKAADRHDPQFSSHGRTVQETSFCIAAPGPVRYLAGSGCGAAW